MLAKIVTPTAITRSQISGARALWLALACVLGVTAAGMVLAADVPSNSRDVAQQPVDTLQTTLSTSGFTPSSISHSAGSLKLAVQNESGDSETALKLTGPNGETVTKAQISEKVGTWTERIEFGPGTYVLSEGNHPEWNCHITINP